MKKAGCIFLSFALLFLILSIFGGCEKSGGTKKGEGISVEGTAKKVQFAKGAEEHFKKGHALLRERKLDEATKEFEETVKLSPDTAVARFWLGNVYFYNKQLDKASAEFKKMTEIEPDNFRGYAMLGKMYSFDKGKIDLAIEELKKALEINPDHVDAHFDLGRIYAMKGDSGRALAEFGFVFRNEPNYAGYHFEMGRIFEGMKAPDKAEKEYERALVLNPKFDKAREALANLKKKGKR
jgi:tetratricopeptide (TPR) repeat protein